MIIQYFMSVAFTEAKEIWRVPFIRKNEIPYESIEKSFTEYGFILCDFETFIEIEWISEENFVD